MQHFTQFISVVYVLLLTAVTLHASNVDSTELLHNVTYSSPTDLNQPTHYFENKTYDDLISMGQQTLDGDDYFIFGINRRSTTWEEHIGTILDKMTSERIEISELALTTLR
jgi:hypothetical protein